MFFIIGTTGKLAPANLIPHIASRNEATIVEVNIKDSIFTDQITDFTDQITDIFLKGKAGEIMKLLKDIFKNKYLFK